MIICIHTCPASVGLAQACPNYSHIHMHYHLLFHKLHNVCSTLYLWTNLNPFFADIGIYKASGLATPTAFYFCICMHYVSFCGKNICSLDWFSGQVGISPICIAGRRPNTGCIPTHHNGELAPAGYLRLNVINAHSLRIIILMLVGKVYCWHFAHVWPVLPIADDVKIPASWYNGLQACLGDIEQCRWPVLIIIFPDINHWI